MSDQSHATRIDTPHAHQPGPDAGGTTTGRQRSGSERLSEDLQRLLRGAWDVGVRLVRQGNRRRVTLRSREGEVWVRAPLTLAVVGIVLLAPAWPLLLVLVAVGFAVGAQLSVERHAEAPTQSVSQTYDGAA